MLAILKLGGSILCDKNTPFSVKTDDLKRMSLEIKKAIEYYKNKGEILNLIIVHGGGSFGHPVAKKYIKTNENGEKVFFNMEKGFWDIQNAMRKFNNIVIEELHQQEVPAVSIQPSSFILFDEKGELHFDTYAIEGMLKRNLIPVIHGDIVLKGENNYKIFSGDHALPYLSKKLNPDLSLHASDVDGVYDLDKKTIKKINSDNINDVLKCLKPSNKQDITGGMYLKVMECYNLGIKTIIFNGSKKDNIYKSLIGEVNGTKIN
ncbi:isopentenyl phosphate kinase [Methanococcus aeolicus]|uniref:Isopentenyl phosphate kinase n=1 Tax=Methanococcus aeolicus (strain ATCC BAA-1280 / DSM 17508 / OCM 812 / Nankai-3) TaxID=419665 RepID=A6UVT7_META3|nr:isopentenyl phosphate kinase [Methanococcus aeolicus]ABR56609.1 aspartate/glutamate/uridylate kinase [Methanococcus aeolicus Nankai-3]UXM84614.1 isopentenyl phosphate kinase [Methanococcus aeolicus]